MIPAQQDIAEFTRFQRNEITESILYERLASIEKDENNRKTLRLIAAEEKSHYAILKKYTGKEIGPDYKRIARFYFLARILGITFAIKLMESCEFISATVKKALLDAGKTIDDVDAVAVTFAPGSSALTVRPFESVIEQLSSTICAAAFEVSARTI